MSRLFYARSLGIRSLVGSIIALHPHAGQSVIEIDAGFTQGASGGGVFNHTGDLIGLATFLTRGTGQLHYFVIPADWIEQALQAPLSSSLQTLNQKNFWESGQFKERAE